MGWLGMKRPETLEWGREGWKGGRTKRELRPRAEKGKVICGSDLRHRGGVMVEMIRMR